MPWSPGKTDTHQQLRGGKSYQESNDLYYSELARNIRAILKGHLPFKEKKERSIDKSYGYGVIRTSSLKWF
jgi:hypothetical protein